MKAWQYTGPGEPIRLTDVEEPVPGPGEVAIQVLASGLCHTEIGFLDGHLPAAYLAKTPITLGHEVAGRVSALGEGVTELEVGDVVGVLSGALGPAFAYDGGFAPTLTAPVDHVLRAPDGIPLSRLAVGADAGMVAHRALVVTGGVSAGTRLGVIGLGGLGVSAVQMGVALGATVYAAEPRAALHEHARGWGVEECFADAGEFAGLDLDVIVDLAGYGTTTAAAVDTVRPGGTVVVVGTAVSTSTINTTMLVGKNVRLLGHQGGSADDLSAYWQFLADGLDPMVTEIGFDEIGEGLERLRRGEVQGRLIAVLES